MDISIENLLTRIADMEVRQISQVQIAHVCNLSEGRISQIVNSEDYKKIKSVREQEELEKFHTLNQGWDSVEATAVNGILEHLQKIPDPEYALKAAAVANRANRRGNGGGVIQAQRMGVRAAITMNVNFVDKIGENFKVINQRQEALTSMEKKDSDFLAPNELENMFAKEKEINPLKDGEEQINPFKALDEMEFVPA